MINLMFFRGPVAIVVNISRSQIDWILIGFVLSFKFNRLASEEGLVTKLQRIHANNY